MVLHISAEMFERMFKPGARARGVMIGPGQRTIVRPRWERNGKRNVVLMKPFGHRTKGYAKQAGGFVAWSPRQR